MNSPSAAAVCGFVGLGSQGAPIARRIIDAGYPTLLWARRATTLEPFRSSEAEIVGTLEELGERADHVGICVTDDEAVREVCDALLPSMRPGSRIAMHSTTHPDTCRVLADRAAMREVVFLEAPVSGGAPAAQAGTLTVMIGGRAEDLAAARAVLETFARLIVHVGAVGTAQIAKLINNTLMVANLGLVHSAFTAGEALQLNRGDLLALLKLSSARSFALDVYGRQSNLSDFASYASLLEKVRLLGTVIGSDHPSFATLRDAARGGSDR